MSDIDHPDFQAWLATAERVGCGDDDPAPPDYVMTPNPSRPDGGWRRIGDVAAKVVAGLIGGAVPLLAAGAVLYAVRGL